ncbi:Lazarus [Heracleum sosnowskyi]|uniref:Lazarus n=1 Tax=Heracleum sosnowskyi TaxID=360622 RepID=A0AAD8GVC7_9APIA|nr:Lazarus [Heracleum sosnowskyi]
MLVVWRQSTSQLSKVPIGYSDLYEPAVIFAGCSVLIALVSSFSLIRQHLISYTKPEEQKWIVGVLLMVPIYAIQSIISLVNPKLSLALDISRNCYEAFAVYSFGSYLIAVLGGERRVVELLESESRKSLNKPLLEEDDEPQQHKRSFIDFFCRPNMLGEKLLIIEKFGLVQYMILKTFCAFLALVLEIFGVYGDGEFKWYYGYPYIAVVLNFSQTWSLYCLVQFYNVTHERLKPIKPLAKFISFKAIVFATWWQGLGLALLSSLGVLPKEGKVETALQDFLICIEMAVAALAHVFVFSARPYHYLPTSENSRVATERTEAMLKTHKGDEKNPAVYEKTSVRESVQDIVVQGGHHVVEDVVLTINKAIEPVEKGVTKIQETFHEIAVRDDEKESEVRRIRTRSYCR